MMYNFDLKGKGLPHDIYCQEFGRKSLILELAYVMGIRILIREQEILQKNPRFTSLVLMQVYLCILFALFCIL